MPDFLLRNIADGSLQVVSGTPPLDLHGVIAPGEYAVSTASAEAPTNLIVSEAAAAVASRATGVDARLSGPALPSGTKALTFEIQGLVIEEGGGFRSTVEYQSTTINHEIDVRAGQLSQRLTAEVSDGTQVFYQDYAGSLPGRSLDLLVTVSLDDGTGTARWSAFADGIRLGTEKTAAAIAGQDFTTNRPLDIFAETDLIVSWERIRIWGGSHAEGYTPDGNVSALTLLPGHDITADQANTGNGTIQKAGPDDWAIS